MLCQVVRILVWIVPSTRVRVYVVPTDPFKWCFPGFWFTVESVHMNLGGIVLEISQGVLQEAVFFSLKCEVGGILCIY